MNDLTQELQMEKTLGLIIVSPLLLILAIAVKVDSKGPAIFKQERIGKDFKTYKMYKFRSMVENAQNMGTGVYSFAGDPRITKVGRFLRKTSLDELPQLWNIVKGDMAFVGPSGNLRASTRMKNPARRRRTGPGSRGLSVMPWTDVWTTSS